MYEMAASVKNILMIFAFNNYVEKMSPCGHLSRLTSVLQEYQRDAAGNRLWFCTDVMGHLRRSSPCVVSVFPAHDLCRPKDIFLFYKEICLITGRQRIFTITVVYDILPPFCSRFLRFSGCSVCDGIASGDAVSAFVERRGHERP